MKLDDEEKKIERKNEVNKSQFTGYLMKHNHHFNFFFPHFYFTLNKTIILHLVVHPSISITFLMNMAKLLEMLVHCAIWDSFLHLEL